MADQTGNYISSFKMTGGVLMFVFVIPFALIFINRRKSSSHGFQETEGGSVVADRVERGGGM